MPIDKTLTDEAACTAGCEIFHRAMLDRLNRARDKENRGGWHDPEDCSLDYLAGLLVKAVADGDLVSIGNFAMMLYCRDPVAGRGALKFNFAESASNFVGDMIIDGLDTIRAAHTKFAPVEDPDRP